MTTTALPEKTHARRSASGADWWMNCPGGPRLAEGIPDVASEFAAEGTAAHWLAEQCLRSGIDPAERIGDQIEQDGFTFEVNDEMADGVQTYIDAVEPYCGPGWEWEIEASFDDLAKLHPDLGGFGDFVAYNETLAHLVVCDFKYGRNISVEPKENPQLLTYGLGAVRRHHNRGVKKVTLIVVQPRDKTGADAVRWWDTDGLHLLEWSNDLIAAAKRTEQPDAPRVPGDWCRFCRAAAICPEAQAKALSAAQAEFATDGTVSAPDPEKFNPDQLGRALRAAEYLETWLKRVREFGHAQATAGATPTGWKLVAKRASRKWRDEVVAEKAILSWGTDPEEVFVRKLKSPAQIETVVAPNLEGKTKKARSAAFAVLVADIAEKVSSGTVLAPIESDKPAIRPEAADEFETGQPGFLQ